SGFGRRLLSLYASLRGDVLFCPGHARAIDQPGIPALRAIQAGAPTATRPATSVAAGFHSVGPGRRVPVGGYGSTSLRISGGKYHRMEFCPRDGGVLRCEWLVVAQCSSQA